MGCGIHIAQWFKTDLGDYGLSVFKKSIAEELSYLKKHTFEKTLLEHKKSNLEATRLWLLLWLELWFKSLKV